MKENSSGVVVYTDVVAIVEMETGTVNKLFCSPDSVDVFEYRIIK